MKVKYIINNYILGSKFKMTKRFEIVIQNRIDRNHTEVIYNLKNEKEKNLVDQFLTYKGEVL